MKVDQSDDPHGVFVMAEKVDNNVKMERQQVIRMYLHFFLC